MGIARLKVSIDVYFGREEAGGGEGGGLKFGVLTSCEQWAKKSYSDLVSLCSRYPHTRPSNP